MEKLHFKIRGVDFQNHLWELLKSGEYEAFDNHMAHIHIDEMYKKLFAHSLLGMQGEDNDLSFYNRDKPGLSEDEYFDGLMTCLNTHEIKLCKFMISEHPQLKAFDKYFNRKKWSETHKDRLSLQVLRKIININKQYSVEKRYTVKSPTDDAALYGVILFDGTYVKCDYQEHIYLYEDLYECGLVNDENWGDETTSLHITEGVCVSEKIWGLGYITKKDPDFLNLYNRTTHKMWNVMFEASHKIMKYGGRSSIGVALKAYLDEIQDKGGKYNGIMFLQQLGLKTPNVSLDAPQDTNGWCIRTSPTKSIGGVLDSVFDITDTSIEDIKTTFEDKNPIEDNVLHLFYQEYIEGVNGVCHYSKDGFSYNCSKERGAVVDGKGGNLVIGMYIEDQLKKQCNNLYKIFGKNSLIQIEFCVSSTGELYYLQLRTFYNGRINDKGPKEYLIKGSSFNGNIAEVDKKDVLIFDGDLPSESLIGKKALIGVNISEFSHIIALAYSLNLPTMVVLDTSVEEVLEKLPERFTIDTRRDDGFVTR